MAKKMTKHQAAEYISLMKLVAGGGTVADYKERSQACVMQAFNVYKSALSGKDLITESGGRTLVYTSLPDVCSTIETFMIEFNDSIPSDNERQKLLAFVPQLDKSSVSELTSYRQVMADREAVRVFKQLLKEARYQAMEFAENINIDTYDDRGNDLSDKQLVANYKANVSGYGVSTLAYYFGEHDVDAGLKFLAKMLRARDRKAEAARRPKGLKATAIAL